MVTSGECAATGIAVSSWHCCGRAGVCFASKVGAIFGGEGRTHIKNETPKDMVGNYSF